jgi:hypothetical protein
VTLAARAPRAKPEPLGHAKPRIAPPTPARSDLAKFLKAAQLTGRTLMPWQEVAGRYLTAKGRDNLHLYREVCIVVARQNGKTTLAEPLIVKALDEGKKVMHIAQTRELPRWMFATIADALSAKPELFPKRRGKTIWPRFGAGQEEIVLTNGGSYRIAASSRGGARGWSNDLVVIDELLEFDDFESMGAIEPTLTMSTDPQLVYFSNAGSDASVVLNSVRDRRAADPSLAYLEWSAEPARKPDEIAGWLEANPAMGHYPAVQKTLEAAYTKHRLAGTLGIFETEHLCRWVTTTQPALLATELWDDAQAEAVRPVRPMMAVGLDVNSLRASAVIAWQEDDRVRLEVTADVRGEPIDLEAFGPELVKLARRIGVSRVAGDPYSEPLLRYFDRATRVTGREFVNASTEFVRLAEGRKLRWQGSEDAIGADLPWATRHAIGAGWMAGPTKADHPITALLAAIRAVGAVTGPRTAPARIF